jgi:hypothetical protein
MDVWEFVSGAPWWVYALFVYLMFIGINAMKPRVVSFKRMTLFPLIFLVWSVMRLYENVTASSSSLIIYWCIFLVVGAYCGLREVHSWKLHMDHKKGLITLPGNYSTLVLVLLIFIFRFVWGYFYETQTVVPYWTYLADTITSSLFTGFFVGRCAFFLKSYLKNN